VPVCQQPENRTFQPGRTRIMQTSSTDIATFAKSPLTGSGRVLRVGEIPVSQLVTDWQTKFGIDITAEMEGVSEVTSYRCLETGLLFFWPPSLEGSAALYKKLQQMHWYYSSDKWEYDFALRQLRRDDLALEVGCGAGHFIERAASLVSGVVGIDINGEAISAARSRGLQAYREDLADWVVQHSEEASVCCSFQVLEHVARPREFIELCIQAVRPGGRIIFGTPNARGYLRHQYTLLDLPPHHMSRWDIHTFRSLERIFPLRLIKYGNEPVQDWNAELYASSAARSTVGTLFPRGLVLLLARSLARSPMKRFLAGHTICTVFQKL
jgi:SAM-dependent methyltransferase